ncbi:unnamed protein product [Chironomus riparius]|uniref:SCP domain-containing protein n=1 Tax=Chironomus riparius TaxID=315576 RepID=A0A9N9S2F9_9DIPT|nr:unnamed protein product [Chironomus riparius]
MKVLEVFLILIFVNVTNVIAATDYCKLCTNHIACNNTGTFANACSSDAVIAELSQAEKNLIVIVHNQLRNKLAGGMLQGFQSATNMSLVAWDSELAQLAELNVRQCEMKHDHCRSTDNYPYTGQNLAETTIYSIYPNINTIIVYNINAWFDEYKLTNQTQMSSCCQDGSGHFTQLIQYRTIAIGCALAIFTNQDTKTDLMACNYSFGNILEYPVYIAGPAASTCANGNDKVYKNLCQI